MNRFIQWYCTLCCVSSLLVLGLILVFAIPGWSQPAHTGKKVISFSGRPTARMFFDDVREMERVMPVVDGVTIYPITEKDGLRTEAVGRLFRKDFHRLVDLDTGIELMRSADTNLYMENFLLVYLDPGIAGLKVPNWFDSEFDAVVSNWKVAAEYCKRAGMVGFLFDNEAYNATNLWDSQRVNHLAPRTIEAYYDKVFERGAEIMRAVSSVYPDIRIITLLGPVHSNFGASRDHFDLTRPFFDGLLSECSGEAMIIDGAEKAYKFKTAAQFEEVAMEFKTEVRAHSRVPEKFDRHARIAFPIFIGSSSSGFSTENFNSNYYSPTELTTALRGALEHTDEYVWVYSQNVNLWRRPGPDEWPLLPVEYREAMLAAHDPALPLPTAVEEEPAPTLPHQIALRQNYPNPFNSNTVIRFALPTADEVDLSLYNLAGQKVASLLRGYRSAGTYTLRWNGRDDNERELASGVYLYRLQAGERVETRKLLLLR